MAQIDRHASMCTLVAASVACSLIVSWAGEVTSLQRRKEQAKGIAADSSGLLGHGRSTII